MREREPDRGTDKLQQALSDFGIKSQIAPPPVRVTPPIVTPPKAPPSMPSGKSAATPLLLGCLAVFALVSLLGLVGTVTVRLIASTDQERAEKRQEQKLAAIRQEAERTLRQRQEREKREEDERNREQEEWERGREERDGREREPHLSYKNLQHVRDIYEPTLEQVQNILGSGELKYTSHSSLGRTEQYRWTDPQWVKEDKYDRGTGTVIITFRDGKLDHILHIPSSKKHRWE
jgi:hypothetical protein